MAIQTVQVFLNGSWYSLTYNSTTEAYEGTLTAPSTTSWNLAGNVYPMKVKATNTAGTITEVDTTDPTVGASLKLRVKEVIKPTITITSPGSGSYVINNKQPIVFQLRDEAGGSRISMSTLSLKIDSGTAVGSTAPGMVHTAVTNGYDSTYTPPTALADGQHTVTINVSDNDGNAATQVTRSYYVDTTPPILNISSPSDDFITNKAAMTIQGTTNDTTSSPVVVTVKLNGVDQGTVSITSGAFSKAITLTEGSNTIVVRSTDTAGKYSESTLTGTLDTTIPVISSVTVTPNPADTGETVIVKVVVTG